VDYQNVFDPNGRVIAMNSTAYKMEFTYDGSNNIIERTDSILSPPQAFTAYYKHLFTYNGANQLTTYIIEEHDGIWKSYKKYEYAYNGQDLTTTTEFEWVNNAWTVIGKNEFTYDAAHNKMSDIYQTWDQATSTFVNTTRLQWTYNSFAQPLTYYSESWDAASGIWTNTTEDFLYRYYYQSFTPTSVDRFTAGAITMVLYPQPASESLNIRVDLEKPEPFTIAIFDVQGRMMKQISGSNINIRQNISLSDLPSGNYFLKLSTADKQQTRQIVVAH
jgi:YD repeat-containing protein